MNYKQFVGSIYLKDKKAIKSFTDNTVVSADPIELACRYSDGGVDAIIVFDMSYNEKMHDESLSIIRQICDKVQVPVYGSGHINNLEDVKKFLYAGCDKAVLNMGKECSQLILKEVSLRFGREHIAATIASEDSLTINKELLEDYVSELVLIDEHALKNCLGASKLPSIVFLPEISLDKMLSVMEREGVSGIAGNIVNSNCKEIMALKKICKESGIKIHTLEVLMEFSEFKLGPDGLVPVVVQDYRTNQVLMVAYMNEDAYLTTLRTGKMTYYSRSRKELWVKGLTSGHYQYVKGLSVDCDNDTLLAKVYQVGAACHTGNYSCFYRDLVPMEASAGNPLTVFEKIFDVIKDRKKNPKDGSYTNYLYEKGMDKILKKVGEEATEIVIAAKNNNSEEIVYEISDFLYHMMVLMAEKEISWTDITEELNKR